MKSNKEISKLFGLFAELLQLHGQDARLAEVLSGAAYRMRRIDETVLRMSDEELKTLFRPAVGALLYELKKSGTIADLDELVQLTPPGLFDMMRIKGLGGKKLAVLWKTAKIDNVEDLLAACKDNSLGKIPGFGAKTEQNIIAAIEGMNKNADRFHYADVADMADELVSSLQRLYKDEHTSLCGDVRRQATTVAEIELITTLLPKALKAAAIKKVMTIAGTVDDVTRGHTLDEMPVSIYHCGEKDFYRQLFERTGNAAHVEKVMAQIKTKRGLSSEATIYKKAGLPFIYPEMREDIAEWEYAEDPLPLIEDRHIKGVVHNHTTWSDGVDKLEAFVNACKKKKYEYAVISDHSQNAHYAGGLKPDKVLRQMEEIDKLNKHVAPFKIFKSIECDILVSGELDYTPELLEQFDLVIISIHQLLKMNEEKATARLIKAIENPYTTILGHMTGRQLLIRPGYPVDFKKVIDACAANGVVIEINANPYRLDMDWSHIPYAMKKGVMISINPDAHSIHEIDNIRWGVSAARKGGLTKDMTWNAMSLKEVEDWLERKNG
ncbi:MAG: helix-hairpin-helix domain-containing protein [Bacteroidota bacterium]